MQAEDPSRSAMSLSGARPSYKERQRKLTQRLAKRKRGSVFREGDPACRRPRLEVLGQLRFRVFAWF